MARRCRPILFSLLVMVACARAPTTSPATTAQTVTSTTQITPAPTDARKPGTTTTQTAATTTTIAAKGFLYTIDSVDASALTSSWREGCPFRLEDLRLITLTHAGFNGTNHTGKLVVHVDHAEAVASVFGRLFDFGFPIERMELVDVYGGDDDASMAANNTSAFNCRTVAGTDVWSEHAFGRAVDINPIQNPYVSSSGRVSPPAGASFLDRSDSRPGMVTPEVVEAFAAIGWKWGGHWTGAVDYQHFSATGR